jgi:hypothetical protein
VNKIAKGLVDPGKPKQIETEKVIKRKKEKRQIERKKER